MADTLTRDDTTNGSVFKTYALSTTNTLFSSDLALQGMVLYGSKYGRVFVPTRVTVSYKDFPRVRVFTKGASNTSSGSVTYYDPNRVPVNADRGRFLSPNNTLLPISKMPSWLSTLITPVY